LLSAERPVIIAGPSCVSAEILHTAAAITNTLCRAGKTASLFFTAPHCNSVGLAMMSPPGLKSALQALQNSTSQTLIVLEADLHHFAGNALAKALLDTAENVVVLDHTLTATARCADLLLPVSTFAESSGTLVNNEGRAQRFYAVMQPPAPIQESWRWLAEAAAELSRPMGQWQSLDDVVATMTAELPQFAGVRDIAPPADFRIVDQKIPRQPARYSGRTAMHANVNVAEPQPPADDPDSPLAFSMEGSAAQPPEPLLGRYWSPGWNSVGALNKFQQEVGGTLRFSNPGKRLIEHNCELRVASRELKAEATKQQSNNIKDNDKDMGKMPVLLMGETPMLRTTKTKEEEEETTRGQDVRDTNGKNSNGDGRWLIVPAYHIFGSDELSSFSPAVASLAHAPYVGMNADDAARANLAEGQILYVRLSQGIFRGRLRVVRDLPNGLAIVPVGLKDSPVAPVCELAEISAASLDNASSENPPSGGRP
ncbi:MAG: hypothetical protein EHM48_08505, partial [Planctomycetaceae bacterium]